MKAGELCCRTVVTCNRGESVVEAAQRMTRYDVGTLVVVEEAAGLVRPVGIITDRDLVTRALARGEPIAGTVHDVMDDHLVIASEDDDIDAVLARLRQRAVRRVPIVDRAGGLVGILSLDDIVEWISEELRGAAALIERQAKEQGPSRS